MMPIVTFWATKRSSSASCVPKDLSPPSASTGIVELADFGEQRLVVDGILVEGAELFEGVVHGVRPRVELCVMLARLLVDLLRIGRQFVVKAVEIDAFATRDQAFLVGTPEIEMPEQRVSA